MTPYLAKLTYSVADAARVLGVSENHVRNQIRAGTMPVLRIGRRTLISRKELGEWIARNSTGGTAGGECPAGPPPDVSPPQTDHEGD